MTSADANRAVSRWLMAFGESLTGSDADAAAELFAEECFWRDLLSFTWNFRTMEGRADIAATLRATLIETAPHDWRLLGDAKTGDGVTEGWFLFETKAGHGKGHIRLKGDVCWTLLTTLQSLRGFEEKTGRNDNRELGVDHGVVRNRRTWLEGRRAEEQELGYTRQPYCLVVGGGQGGIGLAARLRRLEVPTIVVEKNARAGDSWRNRYRSLCLHDPVWYDHMPYIPFPDHWPVFSPKDKLGDWLEMYTKVMELDYWGSAECKKASFEEESETWDVTVEREGRPIHLRPSHLVIATGMSGVPLVPEFPGAEDFQGTICHSSAYQGGREHAGRRCVVVGSNNSAHDICADLWEWGADVTMIQRSPTIVARSESLMKFSWSRLYSEEAVRRGITTEIADLTVASTPYRLAPVWQSAIYAQIREHDAEFYEGLERAGFMCDLGEDGSGINTAYIRRGGGYYIDVGASQLIIDGRIALKSPVTVERIKAHSIVLSDGSEVPAELIVYATGYGPMNDWVSKLISRDVAETVGRCWGVGSGTKNDPGPWEGELRNMWKPTRQPGLWFHGGNLMQSRLYSLFLALQIKARLEGIPTPVHGLAPVYHRH